MLLLYLVIADLATIGEVVVAVREPPVKALRAEMFHVAVGHGAGRRFTIGALSVALFLQVLLRGLPDVAFGLFPGSLQFDEGKVLLDPLLTCKGGGRVDRPRQLDHVPCARR